MVDIKEILPVAKKDMTGHRLMAAQKQAFSAKSAEVCQFRQNQDTACEKVQL